MSEEMELLLAFIRASGYKATYEQKETSPYDPAGKQMMPGNYVKRVWKVEKDENDA